MVGVANLAPMIPGSMRYQEVRVTREHEIQGSTRYQDTTYHEVTLRTLTGSRALPHAPTSSRTLESALARSHASGRCRPLSYAPARFHIFPHALVGSRALPHALQDDVSQEITQVCPGRSFQKLCISQSISLKLSMLGFVGIVHLWP